MKLTNEKINVINCLYHNRAVWIEKMQGFQKGLTESEAAINEYVTSTGEALGFTEDRFKFDLTTMSFIALTDDEIAARPPAESDLTEVGDRI